MSDLISRLEQLLKRVPEGTTPGPWEADRDLPYNEPPRVHGDDHSLICVCGNVGTTQDQWEANAALVALAPDLLSLLRELAPVLREVEEALWPFASIEMFSENADPSDVVLISVETYRRARAAHATLTGGQNG